MVEEDVIRMVAGIKKVRKRPVQVDAVELTHNNIEEVAQWCGAHLVYHDTISIPTLEGKMYATAGLHYVIKGTHGEFYPIQSKIFRANYEDIPVRESDD